LWNKLNSFQASTDVTRIYNLDKELYTQLRKIQIDPSAFISDEDVEKIHADDAAHLAVKAFLNDIENLCAAISIGAVDYEGAYAVHSARIVAVYARYKKFIEAVRQKYDDDEIYVELEKIALAWQKKYLQTKEIEKQKVQKLKAELDAAKGVKQKA